MSKGKMGQRMWKQALAALRMTLHHAQKVPSVATYESASRRARGPSRRRGPAREGPPGAAARDGGRLVEAEDAVQVRALEPGRPDHRLAVVEELRGREDPAADPVPAVLPPLREDDEGHAEEGVGGEADAAYGGATRR